MVDALPAEMSEDEFDEAVRSLIRDAEKAWEANFKQGRESAWKRFRGGVDLPDPKPGAGSKATVPDIRDTVMGLIPEVMEQLAGKELSTEYYSYNAQIAPLTRRATVAADAVFWEAGGWEATHDNLLNAGVAQMGIFKTYRRERLGTRVVQVKDEPAEAFDQRLGRPGTMQVDRQDTYREQLVGADPFTGQPITQQVRDMSSGTLRVYEVERQKRIESVDPSVFYMTDAYHEDDALAIGEISSVRRGDLARMGFSPQELSEVSGVPKDRQREMRRERDEGTTTDVSNPGSWALEPVEMVEAYVRLDRDGDGIPERWKCILAGQERKVLSREPVRSQPYSISVIRRKGNDFGGYSVSDLIWDLQESRTRLRRAMEDNVDEINSPAILYSGPVRQEQLQFWKKFKTINEVVPGSVRFDRPPSTIGDTLPYFETLDTMREQRIGISRVAQGLRPDSLSGTAAVAVAGAFMAAQRALALVVRTFAESGLRPVYQKLLALIIEDDPMLIEGFGQINPREFADDNGDPLPFGVRVKAGLGAVSQQEREQMYARALALIMQIAQAKEPYNYLTTPDRVALMLQEMAREWRAVGAERFFAPPEEVAQRFQQFQQRGTPPDPKVMDAQRKQQEGQAKIQLEGVAKQADAALRQAEQTANMQARIMEVTLKDQRERQKILQEGLLSGVAIDTERELGLRQIQAKQMSNARGANVRRTPK